MYHRIKVSAQIEVVLFLVSFFISSIHICIPCFFVENKDLGLSNHVMEVVVNLQEFLISFIFWLLVTFFIYHSVVEINTISLCCSLYIYLSLFMVLVSSLLIMCH